MKVSHLKRPGITAVSILVLALATIFATASARELAGVTFPETVNVGEKVLKLNGLGLRKKAVFKVYVGGLYLESASKDPAAILASDQAKAIRMQLLRSLSKTQLVDAFREGFDGNAKDKAGQKA